MSVSVTRHFEPRHHAEIVVLEDSLGSRMVLTLPLVTAVETKGKRRNHKVVKTDPDAEIEKAKALMEERERICIEHATARGHIKAPEDSGCQ